MTKAAVTVLVDSVKRGGSFDDGQRLAVLEMASSGRSEVLGRDRTQTVLAMTAIDTTTTSAAIDRRVAFHARKGRVHVVEDGARSPRAVRVVEEAGDASMRIGQIFAAQHEPDGVAKVLTEETVESKVGRQVDANEKVGERVVNEELLLIQNLCLVLDEDMRDGQGNLTDQENEHDHDEHDGDIAIDGGYGAKQTLTGSDLNELVDDEYIYNQENEDGQTKDEWNIEIDVQDGAHDRVASEFGELGPKVRDLLHRMESSSSGGVERALMR